MTEKGRIRLLLFHPEFGGFDPGESLAFASGIVGRPLEPADLDSLTPSEVSVLTEALQKKYPSVYDAAVQAIKKK